MQPRELVVQVRPPGADVTVYLVGAGLAAVQLTDAVASPAVAVGVPGETGIGVTEFEGALDALVFEAAFVAVTLNV